MKKILYVVEAFGGGVFTYLVDLANAAAECYDVTICYALRPQTPVNFKEQFSEKIQFIQGKSFQRSINPIKDLKSVFEIRKVVKHVNPDIVHLHSSKAGFCGRMAVNTRKHKVFYTPHGYSFLKKDDSIIKRIILFVVEKIAAIGGATTICVSKGEYEKTLRITKKALYINNAIDVNKLQVKDTHVLDMKNPVVCTVGRVCYQKNPSAFNEVALKFPDLKFIWIGDGELRNELTAPNIEITGWMQPDEVPKTVQQADIFLLPSLWEGLPIALLEAMYMGKICLASRVIGNRDVIVHGENGFLAECCDDYVEIIAKLRKGEIDAQRISQACRKDIIENYNVEKMCTRYFEVYGE